jgi:hypothetical protein
MAVWRREALQRLPQLRDTINSAPEIMALWIELRLVFERAYEMLPRDDSVIASIYSFADWCMNAPRAPDAGHDPATAVVVAFYEHIPCHPAARDDMPRWFRVAEITQNKEVFARHIGQECFDQLVAHLRANRNQFVERQRPPGLVTP